MNMDQTMNMHIALYPYDGATADGLVLVPGDEIDVVTDDIGDGWSRGKNLTTGLSGVFPRSYADHIPEQEQGLSMAGSPTKSPSKLPGQSDRHCQYVHTVSIEAVLGPFADRLSDLIVITATAKAARKPLPDLSNHGDAVRKAGLNLIQVGHDATVDGDAELQDTMLAACAGLEGAIDTFAGATAALKAEPRSEGASTTLIDGVRGLLYGTTDILSAYDAFDIRKIVVLCESIMALLAAVIEAAHSGDGSGAGAMMESLQKVLRRCKELGNLVADRIPELRNQNHRNQLTAANDMLVERAPLIMDGAAVFLENSTIQEAWETFVFALSEVDAVVREILSLVVATDSDDHTYEQATGHLAARFDALRDELTSPKSGSGVDAVLSRVGALCMMADTIGDQCETAEAPSGSAGGGGGGGGGGSTRDVAEDGEGAVEEELAAKIHSASDALQEASGTLIGFDGGEEEGAHAIIKNKHLLNSKLASLEGLVKDAVTNEMAAAVVAANTPVRNLLAAVRPSSRESSSPLGSSLGSSSSSSSSSSSVPTLEVAVTLFQDHAKRMVEAANNVQTVSGDKSRVDKMARVSSHLMKSAEEMIRSARISKQNPSSEAARSHLTAARAGFEMDTAGVHTTALEILDAARVVKMDYTAVERFARTATEAAQRGLPAAARGATRKMMKRVTHVIFVATKEKANSADDGMVEVLDGVTAKLTALEPLVKSSLKALVRDPNDPTKVSAFVDQICSVVARVNELRAAICDSRVAEQFIVGDADASVMVGEENDYDGDDLDAVFGDALNISDVAEAEGVLLEGRRGSMVTRKFSEGAVEVTEATALDTSTSDDAAAGGAAAKLQQRKKPKRVSSISAKLFTIEGEHEAKPGAKPMMAAAYKLRKAASAWSSKDNKVVALTKEMSQTMATMVQAFNGGTENMGELVTISRQIVKDGNALVKYALECAEACSDRSLKQDITSLCERIPTIGVQLKIHASVCATTMSSSSVEEASHSGNNLVINAQNLMDAVTRTLKACHAASLRSTRVLRKKGEADRRRTLNRLSWNSTDAGDRTMIMTPEN